MSGFDLNSLFQTAQNLAKDVERKKADLARRCFESSAGGGMVRITVRGDQSVEKVEIDPRCVDPQEVEMLEELVLVAIREALGKAKAAHDAEMGELGGGMGMPGLDLGRLGL